MKTARASLLHKIAVGGLVLGLSCAPLHAVGEDEWYDPRDWFDGDNVDAGDMTGGLYDYTYDYDYGEDWDTYGLWGGDVWGPDYYNAEYWDDREWNETASSGSTNQLASTGNQSQSQQRSQSQQQSGGSQGSRSDAGSNQDGVLYTYVLFTPVQEQQGSQQGKSAQQGQSGQQGKKAQFTRLNGTIEGLTTMNLQRKTGATGKHTVAKIKLENGKSTVVSLGRTSQLKDLNLKNGDQIQAVGQKGKIDGQTVFVANSFKVKGRTVEANPAIRLVENQTQQQSQGGNQAGAMTGAAQGGQQELKGEVARVNRSSIDGKSQHTFIDLKLENGRTATVDLGAAASLEKIDLEEGDEITVRGHQKNMQGRQVLVAELLKVDGEKVASVSK